MARIDDDELNKLTEHLIEKYRGSLDEDTVRTAVGTAREEVEETSEISDFGPIFVQRRTEELLRERAKEQDLDLDQVQQVLFIDDENTGRSRMAAAIANASGEGLVRARSAGVSPAEEIPDTVDEVIRDRGLEPEPDEVPPITGKAALASDVVVTLGLSEEELAEMPAHGLHQIDWEDVKPLDGSSAEDLGAAFDLLKERVEELVHTLLHDELGSREVDPEVQKELDDVLEELHAESGSEVSADEGEPAREASADEGEAAREAPADAGEHAGEVADNEGQPAGERRAAD
ncbi:low molecular weight phosphatase family protein [Ornithinimicrobium sp. Y1847]|uniref:arsenate-mycothiol transferase ArsC n=1 Tax=Ornithinimicrobium sp. Y1847 TaxID=3405419 RepID=UPI003B67B50F